MCVCIAPSSLLSDDADTLQLITPVMTHDSNASHFGKWTIGVKVEKVRFRLRASPVRGRTSAFS